MGALLGTLAKSDIFALSVGGEQERMQAKSDDELFQLVGRGDKQALDELFKRHKRVVFGVLLRLAGGNTQKAEDISQHAWMEIIRISPRYNPTGKVRAFILSVARNQARNAFRKDKAWLYDELEEERTDTGIDIAADESMIETENMARLKGAIDQLPDRQRYALTLWLSGELTQKQMSAEMELSEKAFEALLQRAKQNLRKRVKS